MTTKKAQQTADSTSTETQYDLQKCPACHTIEDSSYMTGVQHQGRIEYFCIDCPLPDAA